jgi:hypothetical protein
LFLENSVLVGGHTHEGTALPELHGTVLSGGHNWIDVDQVGRGALAEDLEIAIPEMALAVDQQEAIPPTPFKVRVTHLDPRDSRLVYEELLVTAVARAGQRLTATVIRGQDGTDAVAHPRNSLVTWSATGLSRPGDRHGSLDTAILLQHTFLDEAASASQAFLWVEDATRFPPGQFGIRVSHQTGTDEVVEDLLVT